MYRIEASNPGTADYKLAARFWQNSPMRSTSQLRFEAEKIDADQKIEAGNPLYSVIPRRKRRNIMREILPDLIEDRPITLSVWLIGGSVIALLVALLF